MDPAYECILAFGFTLKDLRSTYRVDRSSRGMGSSFHPYCQTRTLTLEDSAEARITFCNALWPHAKNSSFTTTMHGSYGMIKVRERLRLWQIDYV